MTETKPVRVPVAAALTDREIAAAGGYSTDTLLVNCYVERQQDKVYVVKRPGMSVSTTYNGGGATAGQGMVTYQGAIYAVGSNVLYRITGGGNGSADGSAWAASTSAPFTSRAYVGAAYFNGQYFVMGGVNTGGLLFQNDVWSSTDMVHWTQVVSAAPWQPRARCGVVVLGNTMYLMGGQGNGIYFNDVWSTTDGVTWKQVVGQATWKARRGHTCLAFNQGIFLMGGQDATGTYYNDVWFSSDGATWTSQVVVAGWSARMDAAALVYNELMWVFGGLDGGGSVASVYSSKDGITWTNTGSLPTARAGMAAAVYTNKMFLVAGNRTGVGEQTQVWSSTDGATFTVVTAAYGGVGVEGAKLFVAKTPTSVSSIQAPTMWLVAGFDSSVGYRNLVYRATLNVSLPSSFSIGTTGATTDPFKFTTQNAGAYLILKNTADAWVYYGGQLQKIGSTNYPASTVPGIVNLDDTVYVMDSAGVIYGSNLSDPFTWSALNFITADFESDAGVAIEKYQQYVVAFKALTLQFFQDTGAYPGSPLKPIQNANMRVGCAAANSIVKMDNTLVFMATTDGISRYIAMFDGYNPTRISDASVDRILNGWSGAGAVYATNIKENGHDFYVLTLVSASVTLVYDAVEKLWHTWSTFAVPYFVASNAATNGLFQYLQDVANGIVYVMLPTVYQDNGLPISVSGLGTKFDGGTNQRKFCSSLTVIGDRRCTAAPNSLTISWSDDDAQTFNAGVTVDLSQPRPRVNRLGSFRRRQHKFAHASNNPMRLEALELEVR